jgi:hypothetical protein
LWEFWDQILWDLATNDGNRHWQVSQVTLDKTRKHYEFGLQIWEIVIDMFRKDPTNELENLNLEHVE